MFRIGKIKQLKAENQILNQKIDELKARKTWQEFAIDDLKKQLAEYEELFKIKDQTVVIQQDGKYSKLLIGGKLIKKVTSIEMEKLGAGTLSNFKFGILADEVIIRKKGQ